MKIIKSVCHKGANASNRTLSLFPHNMSSPTPIVAPTPAPGGVKRKDHLVDDADNVERTLKLKM